MNYIWGAMVVFSFIAAVFSGNMQTLSDSIVTSGQDAINLILKLTGMMCLWGGIMKIAEKSELTLVISKMLSPLFSVLYRNVDRKSKTAEAMSMNITANLLGLGNAATPLGLEAMRRMQEANPDKTKATDDMIVFVVMNSAAMRLIPTTVATLRTQFGSASPMEIMPATWVSTILSLAAGVLTAKIISRMMKKEISVVRFGRKRGAVR
ncbi:MAG: spore maturation protein A [Ruminococcaceae bacterium]|nr:spore maturation protein A [Oscillospiraceae bacterium]